MQVELVCTRSTDGVLLHGALVEAPSSQLGVLAVHGAWGNFYATPVAGLLAAGPAAGLTVLSMNARGHDLGSLGDGERCIGFARDVFESAPADLDAAANLLAERGVDRLVAVAHSYSAHRVAYWQAESPSWRAAGAVLVSPAPMLATSGDVFVEGSIGQFVTAAAAAVSVGEPERLIVLSSRAPVPMVVSAATLLSVWGPDTLADSRLHVPQLSAPVLVISGGREPPAYRVMAEQTAAAATDGELIVLDDNHYYSRDRSALTQVVLDWIGRRCMDRVA